MNIGANIRNIRQNRQITQEELAKKINCTQQLISLWEKGKRRIPSDNLVVIAKALGVDIVCLLLGERHG